MADDRSVARRYYEDFLTAPGRIEVADEILHPEVMFHNPISAGGIRGIQEYKDFALRWYRGFPDRHFAVDSEVIEGDRIAIRFTITGTQNGEFMGAAPSGQKIQVNGMNLFILQDNKIKDVQAFFNPHELYDPIGVDIGLGRGCRH